MTKAIVTSKLAEAQKTESLDLLQFIGEQAAEPKEKRRKVIGRQILSSLGNILSRTADVAALWAIVGPRLSNLF